MAEQGTDGRISMLNCVSIRAITALVVLAALALAVVSAVGPESATAKSTVYSFTSEPSTTRAGDHPDVVSEMVLGNRYNQGPMPVCACNDPREVVIHAPAGVIANPHVLSICTAAQAATFTCSANSQVGYTVIGLPLLGFYAVVPLYRTVPQANQAALFEFAPPVIGFANSQYISVNARTGSDYGIDFKVEGLEHLLPPEYLGQVFWGVPARASHNPLRFGPSEVEMWCNTNPIDELLEDVVPGQCQLISAAGGVTGLSETPKGPVAASLPQNPFTQNPTTCVGALESTIETIAYDNEADYAAAPWPATTSCDQLSFDPSLSANPTTSEADTAAGMDVKLNVPQYQSPDTPSPSEIRATAVTLPEGFSINPNAADGKTVCTDVEARFGTTEPAQCPEFSKVGTDVLESSALPGPISGAIYLGEPKPGDRYRIILTAGGFGTFVKLAGSAHLDPQTGQIVVSLDDLPQSPFQEFDLHFFGSERGLLATPTRCGTYPVHTTFTPWAAEISKQESTQFFVIDSGPGGGPCPSAPRLLQPGFEAGAADNTGGAHSEFGINVTRADGDQNLSGLNLVTPPGFSATLKGIPYCPQSTLEQIADATHTGTAELTSPLCPSASLIGAAVVSAGAGTRPLHVKGSVYLAGPYKGAPLSLVVVTPAVSGPYDLGNVVVRAALHVDPLTAQVLTVSDPVPQILDGIPLRLRSVRVALDRPGFALNPTNCDPFSVDASVLGSEGGISNLSAPFQGANCTELGFGPRFVMRLSGGVNRRGHPAIHTVLTAGTGEANIRRVSLSLPGTELLDNAHIGNVCTRVQFAADSCPPRSMLGTAEATTPLLDQPLRGGAYLRSSSHNLPDLVLDLKGQIDIELSGRIDTTKKGGLRTTFEAVPDAPVTRFVLDLAGGSKGLIQNSTSLCGRPKRAQLTMVGQNRTKLRRRVKLQARCRGKARPKRHRLSRVHTRKAVG
jgi:hypothetical protein